MLQKIASVKASYCSYQSTKMATNHQQAFNFRLLNSLKVVSTYVDDKNKKVCLRNCLESN